MKRAAVTANEQLAERFRLITLEGPALEGVAWVPGQKIQIAMGSAFTSRTYTPIEWNSATGRACILGYVHGEGPGSTWLRDVAPHDMCDIFGPRPSLDMRRMAGPLAIFGDETSIGLAYALAQGGRNGPVAGCFEVADVRSCREVMAQLKLGEFALIARDAHDAHLPEIEEQLARLAATGASFVLTGKAGTIQRLRQGLKRLAVPASRIAAKAYWAPGKSGLD
ncbi:siderophore-interacting protein [Sphingomonas psychrotolerans]|uniref:Siderophore-interacting protein n=1 Tax=Sphingomonas psychrotolerans TaxID=1327635 RepID=A0A2K8MHZ0_9SPHN|nr:siderophore-interacting protein [Sphingomonas psychrotolerans]ATY33473.1 siderophore-interacting protein [Sphingomonas psychrotolerans]